MRAQFHPPIRIPTRRALHSVDELAIVWIVGAFLLATCSPSVRATSIPHPHRQPKRIVRIIERMEQQVQQAELTGNTTALATMLSDDYLGISSDGTLATKTETLNSLKSGSTHFQQISITDRKIRVFGSTAVVTSKAKVQGVRDGENVTGQYRYTRVYHRHNGTWKIVSFEASTMHRRGEGYATESESE